MLMLRVRLAALLCLLPLFAACSLFSADPENKLDEPQLPVIREKGIAPEAEELFTKAHVLWKGTDVCSDPAMAVYLLDQAIGIEPGFADAFMRRGLAYSEMGKDEEAFADLTQSIRLDPRAERYAYRGLVLIRQHNLGGARRDLDQSLKMEPGQYRAWNFRAVVNVMEEQDQSACDDFKTGCRNGDCSGLDAAKKQAICR